MRLVLEEKIIDAIEFAPVMAFWDGKPIYSEVEIETRMLGAGDTGPQTGGNQNLTIQTEPTDLINEFFFPPIVYEIAKKHKGLFLFDAGVLSDGEDYYFTEFAGNRWGWGGVYSELTGACENEKSASNYFESISQGLNPYRHKFAACLAVYGINAKEDAVITVGEEHACNSFLYQIKSEENIEKQKGISQYTRIPYKDYDTTPMGYVAGYGESVMETVHCVYEALEDVSMKGLYYRPEEDFLSQSYTSSVMNRFNFLMQQGLIESVGKPDQQRIEKRGMEKFSQDFEEHSTVVKKSISNLASTVDRLASSFSIPAPVVNIDLNPLREDIKSITATLNLPKPKDDTMQNKLVDTLVSGFRSLQETLERKHNELAQSFQETTQPLIDQNKEKLAIMRSKPEKEKGQQPVMSGGGGGGSSSMILRGFGAPKSGRITSTSVGTAIQITTTPTQCRRVDITALPNNQSPIWYGDSAAKATSGSEQGTYLSDTNTATLNVADLSSIWFDVGTSGDGISYVFYN